MAPRASRNRNLSRRDFLKGSLAASAGVFAIGRSAAEGGVLAPSDTIRVAVAGLNSRGGSHVEAFAGMKGVEVAYLVDPDTRTFKARVKKVEELGGRSPECVQDIRRALDDKDVHVVSIATCNHWHALMTIWASLSGKDVYVEKPASHNVREGRIAVEVARKHGRIVQHGTQSRSSDGWARTAALVRSGKLGKLLVSRALCYKRRDSIGIKPPSPPPPEVDFNLWLGPAPEQPHHANLVHYNWHWFWDFGNGDIGNQGVHEMDLARWMIPGATLPRSVVSLGGRFGYTDQGQTANTQVALLDYGETKLVFEVRGLPTEKFHDQGVGNILHLEGGTIAGGKLFPKGGGEPVPLSRLGVEAPPRPPGGIFENFIACVRSRKAGDLHADILEAHHSSALCHLANISYRLGERVPFFPRSKSLGDDRDLLETLGRMEEHLGKHDLKLEGLSYRLGRKLNVDAAAETIPGDPEAQALLTRPYRAPFTVPEKVA